MKKHELTYPARVVLSTGKLATVTDDFPSPNQVLTLVDGEKTARPILIEQSGPEYIIRTINPVPDEASLVFTDFWADLEGFRPEPVDVDLNQIPVPFLGVTV